MPANVPGAVSRLPACGNAVDRSVSLLPSTETMEMTLPVNAAPAFAVKGWKAIAQMKNGSK